MSTVISFTARSAEGASHSFDQSFASAGRWFGMPMLRRAVVRLAEHLRRQRAIAQLQALDDRHLNDIGMARCEIWYRVNHPQKG